MSSRWDHVWYESEDLITRVIGIPLTPLSWVYRAGLGVRAVSSRAREVERPVISVGNLTLGGNGKTPLVIELAQQLLERGLCVAVISRGYGRKSTGCRVVHAPGGELPTAERAGDEPALIAARCPEVGVVVGADRVDAARLAISSFDCDVLLCDDAFQHVRLSRDLNVLAVHAGRGFGNRRLFPRGPLREPLTAMERAELIVFTHAKGESIEDLRQRHDVPASIPASVCSFVPSGLITDRGEPYLPPKSMKVMAACAIADPRGFLESLEQFGLECLGHLFLPDHRGLNPKHLRKLLSRAKKLGAQALVVTEKDMQKIDNTGEDLPILALRLEARWRDEDSSNTIARHLDEVVNDE